MTVIINGSGTANGISYFSAPTTFGGTLATASRGISAGSIPAGSIIQTVYASTSTQTSTTSSTYSDVSGMTATITPTSSTSKILVMMCAQYQLYRAAIEATGGFKIYRGSTLVFTDPANSMGLEAGTSSNGRVYFDGRWSAILIDSPATTSATTYKLQFNTDTNGSSSGSMMVNQQGSAGQISTVTLMEIAV